MERAVYRFTYDYCRVGIIFLSFETFSSKIRTIAEFFVRLYRIGTSLKVPLKLSGLGK